MLHHISLPVSDLTRARTFYGAALGALGYRLVVDAPKLVGFGTVEGAEELGLIPVESVRAAGPGFHLAFAAPSPEAVAAFHAEALRHGGTDNGAPGLRPAYGATYFAGFVLCPDGHRLEAVHIA